MFITGQSPNCVAQCSICDYKIMSKVKLKRKKFEHFLEHTSIAEGSCVRCRKCGIAFTSLARFSIHVSRASCARGSGFSVNCSGLINFPDEARYDDELTQGFLKMRDDFFLTSTIVGRVDEHEVTLVSESTNPVKEKLSTPPILMSKSKGVQTEQKSSEPIQNLPAKTVLRIAEVITHCIVGEVEVVGPTDKPVAPKPKPDFDSQQLISPMGLPESDSAFGVDRAVSRKLNTKVPNPQSAYVDSLLPADKLYEDCDEPIWSIIAPKHSRLGDRGFLLPKAKGERQFYRTFSVLCYILRF